jgi:hypothetical protein
MSLTRSLPFCIILALAAACAALHPELLSPEPSYTEPSPSTDTGVVCVVPDFSEYGPLTSGVTAVRNDSGLDYAALKNAQKNLDKCNFVQQGQKRWALNVLACFDDPYKPVWYEVDWRCLIDKLTTRYPRTPSGPDGIREGFTAWIPETAQVSAASSWPLAL